MSDGKRILIIDDTEHVSQTLCEHLKHTQGYSCVCEQSPQKGLENALENYFDIIVLDIKPQGLTSPEICKTLRSRDVVAPIIVLISDDSDGMTIECLDAGATDCMSKPFKLGVLLARMRAQIRQFEHSEEAQLSVGPFAFNSSTKTLTAAEGANPIRLTDKEAQIIKYLYLHSGRLVSRDELLGEVWGYNAGVTTHTLETHVYRLRQKMEDDPSEAKILVTKQGGYQLYP